MTSRAALPLCLALLLSPSALAQSKGSRDRRPITPEPSAPSTSEAALAFPLQHTRIDADIHGFVSSVTVEHVFDNPYDRAIEARYTFPIPDGAAVDSMRFVTSAGAVEARLAQRGAETEFEDPTARSVHLSQVAPDLLRLVIDSLAPHEEVRVVTRYHHALDEVDGQLVFEAPLVAASRYTASVGEQASLMRQDERRPDRVEVSIHGDFGRPVLDVGSPTHDVVTDLVGSRAVVQLASFATPDADVEVRFTLGGARPPVWVVASPPGAEHDGFAALSIAPGLTSAAERGPRELVFVLDASASMDGVPLDLAREIVRRTVQDALPDDRFRLLRFCDGVEMLSTDALAPDQDGLRRADSFLDGTRAFGPSEMDDGLREALALPNDPERDRVVVLLSDGFVGDATPMLRAVADRLDDRTQLFTLGVGSASHRYLLRHLAEIGGGQARFVAPFEAPGAVASRLLSDLAAPRLADLRLDWGRLQVNEAARLPGQNSGAPFVIYARYARGGRGRVTLRGLRDDAPWEVPLELGLPGGTAPVPGLEAVFLRARLRDDARSLALFDDERIARRLIDRAVLGGLLSPFTTFVATDTDTSTDLTRRLEVEQPHDRPAGS